MQVSENTEILCMITAAVGATRGTSGGLAPAWGSGGRSRGGPSSPHPRNEIGMNGNGRVNGRLPRYHQIAGALRTRIREGALRPGARLDNQRRLAKSFGVTLMTLRQALELLEREHLIARR